MDNVLETDVTPFPRETLVRICYYALQCSFVESRCLVKLRA